MSEANPERNGKKVASIRHRRERIYVLRVENVQKMHFLLQTVCVPRYKWFSSLILSDRQSRIIGEKKHEKILLFTVYSERFDLELFQIK